MRTVKRNLTGGDFMTLQEIARRHYGEMATYGGETEPARVIEIHGTRKTAIREYNNGWWNLWTDRRIKGAFEFDNGTFEDLKKYAAMNRQYATFVNLETGEVI
jgi:hypothetical protein